MISVFILFFYLFIFILIGVIKPCIDFVNGKEYKELNLTYFTFFTLLVLFLICIINEK